MASPISNGLPNGKAPIVSHDAVFKPSAPVPEGVPMVNGVDFNDYKSKKKDITAAELVSNMAHMGFQASAVAEAARIIDDMVDLSAVHPNTKAVDLTRSSRKTGGIHKQAPKLPSSLATHQTSSLPDSDPLYATLSSISTFPPS